MIKFGQKLRPTKGLIYIPNYVSSKEKAEIFTYLKSLYPIWEMRYSKSNPPPENTENRELLRPVYWLGNWQFACLNYYHPPKGIHFRCVEAEPFPLVFQKIISNVETMIKGEFLPKDIPRGWHFNTCLINYYGEKQKDGKFVDGARVGEHKDFEPGPVASLSFGERALIQFVKSEGKNRPSHVVQQQWLEDCSLQIFGSDRYKKDLFHRVQRVDTRDGYQFDLNHGNFVSRRINFTFRYVPNDHIQPLNRFPKNLITDIAPYTTELASKSRFWKQATEFSGI